MVITRDRDIPTVAGDVPVYLQRDVMPSVWEESCKTPVGMDTIAIQQEPGMGIGIRWCGELKLFDFLCVSSHCNSLASLCSHKEKESGYG